MAVPRAYYNEIDKFAAAWLRELTATGVIPDGDVDERSIWDVLPEDLRGYTQCHFFAGIGGWAYACRLAGIPDDQPIWTGSCPCQPFSAAGKGLGFADERHAWPAWWHLIEYWRPALIVGEQVDKATAWLDLVLSDLEGEGYTCRASDLPAGSVGAFHRRQRLWFVAESLGDTERGSTERERFDMGIAASSVEDQTWGRERLRVDAGAADDLGGVAHASRERRDGIHTRLWGETCRPVAGSATLLEIDGGGAVGAVELGPSQGAQHDRRGGRQSPDDGDVGDPDHTRPQGFLQRRHGANQRVAGSSSLDDTACAVAAALRERRQQIPRGASGNEAANGRARWDARESNGDYLAAGDGENFWRDADWLPCRDGKSRPVEPGTFPLAHGVPARVGRLRGYGNAIVPQVGAAVLRAYCDERADRLAGVVVDAEITWP